jgi:hypothetical protein
MRLAPRLNLFPMDKIRTKLFLSISAGSAADTQHMGILNPASCRQMPGGFGGTMSFVLLRRPGGVYQQTAFPHKHSPIKANAAEKSKIGITGEPVRLAAGTEEAKDLINDRLLRSPVN